MAGPASRSPERNWLDTSPRTVTSPPVTEPPTTSTGRWPAAPTSCDGRRRARAARRATAPIGRARIRLAPSTRRRPVAQRSTGSRNRLVVPDRRASIRATSARGRPAQPVTVTRSASQSASTSTPSASQARRASPRCRRRAGRRRSVAAPVGQRGADERPVGDALRAGQRDGRRRPARRRDAMASGSWLGTATPAGEHGGTEAVRHEAGPEALGRQRPRRAGSGRPGRPRSSGRSRGRRC